MLLYASLARYLVKILDRRYLSRVKNWRKNWRKALGMFQKHETTPTHKDSIVLWYSNKASLSQGNVVQQIETVSSEILGEQETPF